MVFFFKVNKNILNVKITVVQTNEKDKGWDKMRERKREKRKKEREDWEIKRAKKKEREKGLTYSGKDRKSWNNLKKSWSCTMFLCLSVCVYPLDHTLDKSLYQQCIKRSDNYLVVISY